jgi:hypothetical protein
MIATYEMTLKVIVKQEIDKFPDENLKSDREYAENVCQMIADEAIVAGGVASYEIIESSINVK